MSAEARDHLASSLPAEKKQLIYAFTISAFTVIELIVMLFVLFFYLLDSLLNERKDRSILFWKSLPVSDTEVVVSKLLTAVVVTPIFVLLVTSVLQVLFALVWSVRFSDSVLGNLMLAWHPGTWLHLQAAFLMFLLASMLWFLPWVAYLLIVSVWARRNAFLWAVLPPLTLLLIEKLLSQSNYIGDFLGRRLGGIFQLMDFESLEGKEPDRLPPLSEMLSGISTVFTSMETWLGVLVAAATIFVTIRIRRHRDDS
jgi:ABC-2 type transport system permease protein